MTRRSPWHLMVTLAVLVSCGSGGTTDAAPGVCSGSGGDRPVAPAEPSSLGEVLEWSGFESTFDLEVVGFEEHCGIDVLVEVAFVGEIESLDAALDAAGFDAPATPGVSVSMPPMEGVDVASLEAPVSAVQQSWENSSNEQINRMYVRGRSGGAGEQLLHLWAFTI